METTTVIYFVLSITIRFHSLPYIYPSFSYIAISLVLIFYWLCCIAAEMLALFHWKLFSTQLDAHIIPLNYPIAPNFWGTHCYGSQNRLRVYDRLCNTPKMFHGLSSGLISKNHEHYEPRTVRYFHRHAQAPQNVVMQHIVITSFIST